MSSKASDPGDPRAMPLNPPETPRWRKRHLGVAAVALLFAALAVAAWRYEYGAPPMESAPTVLPRP